MEDVPNDSYSLAPDYESMGLQRAGSMAPRVRDSDSLNEAAETRDLGYGHWEIPGLSHRMEPIYRSAMRAPGEGEVAYCFRLASLLRLNDCGTSESAQLPCTTRNAMI